MELFYGYYEDDNLRTPFGIYLIFQLIANLLYVFSTKDFGSNNGTAKVKNFE